LTQQKITTGISVIYGIKYHNKYTTGTNLKIKLKMLNLYLIRIS